MAGHGVDKAKINKTKKHKFSNNDKEQIFATGVIALAAKLSKVDGKVTQNEIDTFKKIFEFPNNDIKIISQNYLIQQKKIQIIIKVMHINLRDCFLDKKVLNEILNALFAIAYADKILHIRKKKMLIEISKIFKISNEDYNRIKNIYNTNNNKSSDNERIKNYKILGVSETDSLENIKKNIKILLKNTILIESKERVCHQNL